MKKFTEKQADEIMDKMLIEYFKTAPMVERVAFIGEWNWDYENSVFDYFIDDSETDKAAILRLFWFCACGSTTYGERMKRIEEKYLSGFYQNSNIFYDPTDDRGTNWTKEADGKYQIKPEMYIPLAGEKVPNYPWIEGVPTALQSTFDEIMENTEPYD